MAKIRYINHSGAETVVEAKDGNSIMQTAVDNGIDGIVAECGGGMSCATCHVYFDEEWSKKLEEPNKMEKEMLEFVIEPHETSRLSCQIKIHDGLDGIVVHIPESQY